MKPDNKPKEQFKDHLVDWVKESLAASLTI